MAAEKKLKATLVIGATLSGSFKMALGGAKESLNGLGKTIQNLSKQQAQLGSAIQTFGRMGKNVDGMRIRYGELAAQLDKAKIAQVRLNKATERYNTLTGIGTRLGAAGVGFSAAGAAIGLPVFGALNAAKAYQTQMARMAGLGFGKAASADALNYATRTNVYGVSNAEKLGLMTDAMSIFGNVDDAKMALPMIAKAYFANRAIYGSEDGDEKTNDLMTAMKVAELRGGTSSPAEFAKQVNMIQQVINATQGKVNADQWKDLIKTGGIAAKGMDDNAFYYELEPSVQEMGGHAVGTALQTAYQELYQGHTTRRAAENLEKYGLIGDPSKLSYDKSGQVAFLNPGALKGSDLFQKDQFQWMKQVLLPMLAAHGITSQKDIMDAIGSIMGRTAANLYSTWYKQQQQIDRRAQQNAEAQNVDQMNATAQDTAAGKEAQAEAKLADLKLRLGTDILPTYTSALTLATGALEKLNAFTAKHPKLAKAMMIGVAGLGASLAVLGPVLMTVGGALATYAGFSLFATKASLATDALRVVGTAFTSFGGVVRTAIAGLGRAFMAFGTSFLVDNPIGWIVAGVAALGAATYLIYENWIPIKDFFKNLWSGIVSDFKSAFDWIQTHLATLGQSVKSFMLGSTIATPNAPNAFTSRSAAATHGSTQGGSVSNQYNITIHAAPGQDGGKLWEEMQKRIDQARGANSSMYDSAFGFGT